MNHGTNQIAKALRIVVLMGLLALAAPATTLAGRPASESPATAGAAGAAPGSDRSAAGRHQHHLPAGHQRRGLSHGQTAAPASTRAIRSLSTSG